MSLYRKPEHKGLAAPNPCPHCGSADVEQNDNFCHACGKYLFDEPEKVAPTAGKRRFPAFRVV